MDRHKALRVLGLGDGSVQEDVKRSFRRLAQQYHPDKHPGISLEEKADLEKTFNEIVEAARFLADDKTNGQAKQDDDFLSALRKITPQVTPEQRREVQEREAEERRQEQVKKIRQESAERERKAAAQETRKQEALRRRIEAEDRRVISKDKTLLEADLNAAEEDAKSYVVELHSLRRGNSLLQSESGYASHAKQIADIPHDHDKKIAALSLISKSTYICAASDAVAVVNSLCELAGDDSAERIREVTEVIAEFNLPNLAERVDAYPIISALSADDIRHAWGVAEFLKRSSVILSTHDQLDEVIRAVSAFPSGMERIARKSSIREYINPKDPVGSFLSVVPVLLAKGGDRALSAAGKLFALPDQKKNNILAMDIASRLVARPDDLSYINDLISELHWQFPFRSSDPLDNYIALERITENAKPTDQRDVAKLIHNLGKWGRNARPDEIADMTLFFLSLASDASVEPDKAVQIFSSFVTKAMIKDGPGWTDEMRKAHRVLEIETNYFPDKKHPRSEFQSHFVASMEPIVRGFFSTYRLMPDEIYWVHPYRNAQLEERTRQIARIRQAIVGIDETYLVEFTSALGKFGKNAKPVEMADKTILFFDRLNALPADPKEALGKFRYFLAPRATRDRTVWTAEMLRARLALEKRCGQDRFSEPFDVIVRGFFAVYRILPSDTDPASSRVSPSP